MDQLWNIFNRYMNLLSNLTCISIMTEVLRRSVRKLNFAQCLLLNTFKCSECSICPKLFFHKKSTICSWVFQLDFPDYLVIVNLFRGNILTIYSILLIGAVSSRKANIVFLKITAYPASIDNWHSLFLNNKWKHFFGGVM